VKARTRTAPRVATPVWAIAAAACAISLLLLLPR